MKPPLTLAAAWQARGIAAVSRSFRFHRRRGAFCHRGWCQQCKTRLPDGRIVLACQAFADASGPAAPPTSDALRPVGALAEHTPPWFWERQTLGGAWQQAFVGTLRRLSAAPPLPTPPGAAARSATVTRECTTLVIGGGPAGSIAATALAHAGRACLLVQAGVRGGAASPLHATDPPSPISEVSAPAAFELLERHLCVGLYDAPRRALCVGAEGNVVVRFDELVVATGAYDRLPTVPGNDTPGVVGVRAFERLVAQDAVAADTRIGIYANVHEAARAIEAASRVGCALAFVAGPADLPHTESLRRPSTRLARVVGRARVTGVAFHDGTTATCDLLVVGFTQPSYEFQAQNGCGVALVGDPPIVQPTGSGNTRMLVVGEAAGWTETGPALVARTGAAVNAWLGGDDVARDRPREAPAATRAAIDDDAFVCLCEDVRAGDIRRAFAEGYDDVELVKRHTGAGTGPCQGKLCHAALLTCVAAQGGDVRIPTPRPLVRPVTIGQLAGAGDRVGD